ncbi:MAG: type II secretion system protein GspM [Pseudomonadota bacterium]
MSASFEKWKDLLGQFEVLKTYYAWLTERERYIVLGIGAGGIVFLLFVIYASLLTAAASKASQIDASRGYLKELAALKTEYTKTERQLEDLEQVIRRSDPNFQLATELERMARKHSVSIDSIKDRPGPPNDYYRETQAVVAVKQITIANLINFLFDIEHSKQLIRITSLQVKPGFQDPTQLGVNFVVSTFQPGEGL